MCAVNFFPLLLVVVATVLLRFEAVSSEVTCLPVVGKPNGSMESANLRVEIWQKRSRNLQWSDPQKRSAKSHTIRRDAGIVKLADSNVIARFSGGQLCIALRKVTEKETSGGGVDRIVTCHRSCLSDGGSEIVTNFKRSGGRIVSSNPPCCFGGRRTELRFSTRFSAAPPRAPTTPPQRKRCVICNKCSRNDSVADLCDVNDKCFTIKLQEKKSGNVTTQKGCSSMLPYMGDNLSCDYECKTDVILFEGNGDTHHKICISCCSGDKCNYHHGNKNSNSTAHTARTSLFSIMLTVLFSLVKLR